MKKLLAVLLALTMLVSLCACGSTPAAEPTAPTAEATAEPEATDAAEPEEAATRTFTDMVGREVVLPAEITKIACNAPNEVTTVAILGALDRLVACYDTDYSDMAGYIPGITEIPYHPFGQETNLEEFVSSGAEVCFLRAMSADDEHIAQIEGAGIPVVCVYFTDVSDRVAAVSLMADILGGEAVDKGATYIEYVNACADKAYGYEQPAEEDKVSVLAFFTYMDGQYIIPSNDHFVIQTLEKVGAVSASDYTENTFVNIEDIIALDPDVLVNLDGASGDEYCKADDAFCALEAYQNGNYYVNPVGIATLMTTGTAECCIEPLYLASILNKNASDIDFKQVLSDYYTTFYGYTPTAEQLTSMMSGAYCG